MMMPSIFRENLWNDLMDFSFPELDGKMYGKRGEHIMRTDVKEHDDKYEVDIELPGFKKEDVKAELKDGYLTITALKEVNNEQKNENGKYVRRERYTGNMSRSFYVGDKVTQEEIRAKFEDGILKLQIPKKDPKKQVEDKHYVTIE
ncbi:MAG: Hsp20/alpha crystallin family protein [Lachnospiraceae bacterium]|nr:Hsp20/alpha crystallin family protein [Lachnospiraceae bacterium]